MLMHVDLQLFGIVQSCYIQKVVASILICWAVVILGYNKSSSMIYIYYHILLLFFVRLQFNFNCVSLWKKSTNFYVYDGISWFVMCVRLRRRKGKMYICRHVMRSIFIGLTLSNCSLILYICMSLSATG